MPSVAFSILGEIDVKFSAPKIDLKQPQSRSP